MLRFVVFVIAITTVFAGTLAYGGMRMGAWEEADPVPPSGQAPLTRADDQKKEKDKGRKKGRSESAVAGSQASSQKARWVREANALCRRASRETGGLNWPRNLDKAEALFERIARINVRYDAGFAALRPVKADRAEVARVRALFREDKALIADWVATRHGGRTTPKPMLEMLNRLSASAQKRNALLTGLGAVDCGAAFYVPSAY